MRPSQLITNTETFNTSLGQFTLQTRNNTAGNELNWQDLNNAGGSPGELGGFSRARAPLRPPTLARR